MALLSDIFDHLEASEKKKLIGITVINAILALADIVFLALLVYFISLFPGKLHTTNIPQSLLVYNGVPFFAVFALLFLGKNLVSIVVTKYQYNNIFNIASRISKQNAANYLEGDFNEFIQKDSSSITTRILQHPSEFALQIVLPLQQIVTETVVIAATITAILIYNTYVFISLVILLAPLVFFVSRNIKSRLKRTRENIVNHRDITLQYLNEALKSYVEANIYHKKDFFINRYGTKQQLLSSEISNLHFLQSISSKLIEVFAIIGLFLLIVLNTIFASTGNILVPIGAFMAAAYKLVPGALKLMNLFSQVGIHKSLVKHLYIERKKTTEFKEESIHSIQFRDLSFSYENKSIINRFNASIQPGKLIGIKARSGKGKTTLLNILIGFLSEKSGEILINEKYVDPASRRKIWPRISYVKQDGFFIHESILRNVVFDDHLEKSRLQNIATATDLFAFIDHLPQQWETVITENGKNISGGQKQRIAIARALYKDADLYILDEPFNELDKDAEMKILQHFKNMSKAGKTVLLVTHDTETLQHCDEIIAIDG